MLKLCQITNIPNPILVNLITRSSSARFPLQQYLSIVFLWISDWRPHSRNIDAGWGDNAAEASRLRHGGGRAAHLRRRHQAEPRAPAAGRQLRTTRHAARRRRHPRPARGRAARQPAVRSARAAHGARSPRAGPQDAPAALQPHARHQMKARPNNFVTLNRLLFHVMRLVYSN